MQKVSAQSGAAPSPSFGERVKGMFQITEFVLFLIVVLLFVVGGIINPRFLGIENLKIMTRDSALLAIASVGMTFVLLTAGIDLSVGSIVGLAGVVVAIFMMWYSLPIWLAILFTLAIGVAIGLYHGLFVTKLKMHGFLITLVTMGLARGAILVMTNAFPVTGLPRGFTHLGQGFE